jgi:hypothetical protein
MVLVDYSFRLTGVFPRMHRAVDAVESRHALGHAMQNCEPRNGNVVKNAADALQDLTQKGSAPKGPEPLYCLDHA